MKLYGILVVQNESDVISDLLAFLKTINIYEKIFFYDLGSRDDTFEKALGFKEILHNPQVLKEPYTEKLRFDLLEQQKSFYEPGDWIAIIDADEFYVDNPVELIQLAENEGATFIQTYQINVMFTDIDLKRSETEKLDMPVHERLKYYLINYSEERFFKYLPEAGLFSRSKPFSRRLLNRHYQYRSPSQIRKRIQTRLENRKRTASIRGRHEWPQIFSTNWRDYVISHQILHKYEGGEFQFGRPKGVRWKEYYSKDPFSAILPQVAEVFMKERAASKASKELQKPAGDGEVFEIGRVTFEDRYGLDVWNDIRGDFRNGHWMQTADGLFVFVRYHLGVFRRFLRRKLNVTKDKMKNRAWNISTTLKRFIRGKSIGVISANPNPIQISDNSGVGVTTVKWKTIRSRTIEIHIDAPDGARFHLAGPSGMKPTENWVSDDTVFWLQDVTNGLPLTSAHTLARTNVKVMKGKRITI